ncbi:MAG: GNAT family N-acetyltransferase [Bacteroidia bacterium]|nr:GNAT family N-acetyltransferase [Bacteroidia bacterium]
MEVPAQLETERLLIRPLRENDFEGFYSFLTSQQATENLFIAPEERSREGVKAFFDEIILSYDSPSPIFALGVEEKTSGRYVGAMGLTALKDGVSAEAIFIFLPDFWGMGFASEAGEEMMSYALEYLLLDKVVLFVSDENRNGAKLAKNLGMHFDEKVPHREYPHPVNRFVRHRE